MPHARACPPFDGHKEVRTVVPERSIQDEARLHDSTRERTRGGRAGLRKQYGDVTAVDGIDLGIRRGEVFGLLGPSGAGKSATSVVVLPFLVLQFISGVYIAIDMTFWWKNRFEG